VIDNNAHWQRECARSYYKNRTGGSRNCPGALPRASVHVDLLRKFVKASDDPIEGWRLAVKHSVCNHLLVVDSKSLEKRCRWNQTQAPDKQAS
jgi:hypothetical protein